MFRDQSSALTCHARLHRGWVSPLRTKKQRPEQRPHLSCQLIEWLDEPTITKRTETRTTPSHVMPANTVAGSAHSDQANIAQSSTLICRVRHHSGLLSQSRPNRSWFQPPLLAESKSTKRTEARSAPSPVVPSKSVNLGVHAEQEFRSQIIALHFRACLNRGWLSSSRRSEQKPQQRPYLYCCHHSGLLSPAERGNRGQSCALT